MADPTETAAEAASQFRNATSRGADIRSAHVGDLIRSIQEAVKRLSPAERDDYLATLASYVDTIAPSAEEMETRGRGPAISLNKDAARRLSMAPDTELTAAQATLLLNRALLFLIMVDQLVWGVWKNIAPDSRIRRETKTSPSMPNVLRTFLGGGSEVTEEEVIQCFEKTRQLAAGLLGALGPVGRNYGTKATARFNPDAVREIVTKEGGKGETQYWKKYEELFQDLNEENIEQEIHQAIVRYAEDLLRGARL